MGVEESEILLSGVGWSAAEEDWGQPRNADVLRSGWDLKMIFFLAPFQHKSWKVLLALVSVHLGCIRTLGESIGREAEMSKIPNL